MKYVFCIYYILLINCLGIAQKFQFSYYAGFGTYQLDDLKNYQKELVDNDDLPTLKIVEAFPAYLNHALQLEYQGFKNIFIGLNGGYLYTGARCHYQDYSGEYKLDFQLHAYKLGVNIKYVFKNLIPIKNIDCYLNFRTGLSSTLLNIDELVDIYMIPLHEDRNYVAKNMYLEPAAGFNYQILRFFSLGMYVGYEYNFSKPLYKQHIEDQFLKDQDNNKVDVDWSGFRPAISISVSF